jgi:Sec-independent protein translocase protein TatA
MGYREGGGVIDETMQDNLVDETNKKQIENKDMSFLQNLLGQNDMNFQFKQYSDMLSKIASPRPAASGYDLASALGRGLLAQQSEKFPSVGRGLGLGFQEFSKLQKEIDEENRKAKQARDMTAFGLVANRKAKQEPSGKVMEMFVNDDQQFYKSILVGNEVKFIGPKGS